MTEENTHEEQRTPPIGDDKLGAILFDFPATMSGGTLKMTFYPRHSDGFTADAEGRLHSRDMEQLIMYMGRSSSSTSSVRLSYGTRGCEPRRNSRLAGTGRTTLS